MRYIKSNVARIKKQEIDISYSFRINLNVTMGALPNALGFSLICAYKINELRLGKISICENSENFTENIIEQLRTGYHKKRYQAAEAHYY